MMGDRYIISIKCPYCKHKNEDVYYADSCGMTSHKCDACSKTFDIDLQFVAIPKEESRDD